MVDEEGSERTSLMRTWPKEGTELASLGKKAQGGNSVSLIRQREGIQGQGGVPVKHYGLSCGQVVPTRFEVICMLIGKDLTQRKEEKAN